MAPTFELARRLPATDASADEQTARAKMLYNRSGAGQWPHCGKNLFS